MIGSTLLQVKSLNVEFCGETSFFNKANNSHKALNNISFELEKGDVLGIVGESGSGKTTLARTIINLVKHISSTTQVSGDIYFNSHEKKLNCFSNNKGDVSLLRKNISIIFQDPFSSLNPRMTVYQILSEPFEIHFPEMDRNEISVNIDNLLSDVGLLKDQLMRYPHEFSGGQKQRIAIARSIALKPELLIADEPVSALDVSIQAQILNLIVDLKEKNNLTIIFITHDISVVRYISTKIAVMYKGDIVEFGDTEKICNYCEHPYTKQLISLMP